MSLAAEFDLPKHPVRSIIPFDELEEYKKAAKETGFEVEITGSPGDKITFEMSDEFGKFQTRSRELHKGQLQVEITTPKGVNDHGSFWDRLKKIREEKK